MQNFTVPSNRKLEKARLAFDNRKKELIERMAAAKGTQMAFCDYLKARGITPNSTRQINELFANNGKKMEVEIAKHLVEYVKELEAVQVNKLAELETLLID